MRHYLFDDKYTCKDYIVDAESLSNANEIARENLAEPIYVCELTDWQAKVHWGQHI